MSSFSAVLAFCPNGYFEIQYSNAYLKSYLKEKGLETKCLDLNISFYHQLGLAGDFTNRDAFRKKYAIENDLMNVGYWSSREMFYQKIFPLGEVQQMINSFADQILQLDAPLVGFSCFETNRFFSLELAKLLKSKRADLKIVLGGPDCTTMHNTLAFQDDYHLSLKNGAVDAICIGEGEQTFYEVVRSQSPAELKEIKGLLLFDLAQNKVIFTGERELFQSIDQLPIPDFSDFKVGLYQHNEFPVVFNRGCNYSCSYCNVKNVWTDRKLRCRSAQDLFNEVKQRYKLVLFSENRLLSFKGAYINSSKELLSDLSDLIIGEWGPNPLFQWSGYCCVNKNLTRELCDKMKLAGCYHLVIGLESASENVTRPMRKAYPQNIAAQVVQNIGSAGIKCSLFIIVGFPTESEEDFQLTLDFISENAPYLHQVYCQTEFIMSSEMFNEPDKWNLKVPVDPYLWETKDESNTPAIRKDRLNRFYTLIEELGLNCYAPTP